MAEGWPKCPAPCCNKRVPPGPWQYKFEDYCDNACKFSYVAEQLRLGKSTYILKAVHGKGLADVECSKCGETATKNVCTVTNHGCKCQRAIKIAKSSRMPTIDVDAKLASLNLKRLSKFKSMNKDIKLECLVCGHIRTTVASSVLRFNSNCPSGSCRRAKVIKNSRLKYGVDFPAQLESTKAKFRATCQARYGVDYPMQSQEIFEKMMISSERNVPYKLGKRMVFVQGYEPWGLDHLLENGTKAKHILVGTDIPPVPYKFQGSTRNYFPDIYIVSEHRIIEVKSDFSYQHALKQNLAKARACVRQGFLFTFLIFDRYGNVREENYS